MRQHYIYINYNELRDEIKEEIDTIQNEKEVL